MVAKNSRGSPSAAPLPPIGDLHISVEEEPVVKVDEGTSKRKKSSSGSSGGSGGFLKAAKSRATGTLRRHLFGRSTKRRARDAEDAIPERDEDEDYTSDNYDTVKSLPASGHYGRSRVGNPSSASSSHTKLQELMFASAESSRKSSIQQPPVIIFKVPRRQRQPIPSPAGPVRAPLSDPVFEYYTWNTADDRHNKDAVYSLFCKAHKCYDLIPTSTKLVVFDTKLPVRKAFYALVYNGVRAAPLWDSAKQQFIGMLTITDFIKILIKHYEAGDNAERIRALENQNISHWRENFDIDGSNRPFVYIDPCESLHRAVEVLCESKVHRLPVLDKKTGNIVYILTHKRIMKFLSLYMNDLPQPTFMKETPRELGIGCWGDVLCCHVDTPIHDALELFLKNRVSALPLIDKEGRVADIYAKFDVISLAAENSYDKLDCTVQEALSHRSEWFEGVRTCLETDSLFSVIEQIVKAEVHRLIVTDADKKVVGVVSLSDILKYLVLDPAPSPTVEKAVSETTLNAEAVAEDDKASSSIPEVSAELEAS